MENLIRAGAFDCFGGYRSQLISVHEKLLDSIGESRRQNLEGQMDFFTDWAAKEREERELTREKRRQQAVLSIRKKFGKNAILKGMNYEEGATTRDRNGQIGGHKA